MVYYSLLIILLFVIAYQCFANTKLKDFYKYKFLFRNDIYSSEKKENPTDETVYHLAPVMRGKAYRPYYRYLTERDQYLVCCDLEPFGFRRYDAYAPPHTLSTNCHVLLDNKGVVLQRLDSDLRFSVNTGMFFTPNYYIDWLETGDTTTTEYAGIYNKALKMTTIEFADTFRELYAKADYMEFVNLRTGFNDEIDGGVVFQIKKEWHILLDGCRDSHIYCGCYIEDKRTGVDHCACSVKFDYYDPDKKRKDPYPQSPPLVKGVYLETEDPNPFYFNRRLNHDGLKLVNYQKLSSTGWHGVAEIKGIPIFVPGTGEGIAFMEYKTGKQTIHFKIPAVTKYDYRSKYALGVRVFRVPDHLKINEPLVFIESLQNFAHFLRDGGGIYVVRPSSVAQRKASSLPFGLSDERLGELPLNLQIALIESENTSQLKIDTWYPEINFLHNLRYLKIAGSHHCLPDDISVLTNLEVLDLSNSGMKTLPSTLPKMEQLKVLDLECYSLKTFPPEVCEISSLTHLHIGCNDIDEIPSSIAQLTNLRVLNLYSIDKITLPESIINMKALRITRADDLKATLPERFHFLFEKEAVSE